MACAAFFGGCNQSASGTSGGGSAEVAAKVNSVAIPMTRVERQLELTLKPEGVKPTDLSPIELASTRLRILEQLISQEIMVQRAQKDSVQVTDDEVRQAVQAFIREKTGTQEEFQKQLKDIGLTEEEFRNEQRQILLINKWQEKQKVRIPAPSEKEISDFYTQNRDQFKIGRGVYLSQIMVDPANNGLKNDAIGAEQAKQKIAGVSTRLKAGDDFATVARLLSEDMRTAVGGGDMGFAPEEAMAQTYPDVLVKRFFTMREGEITEPIQGSEGRMYIFKVTGKKTEPEELKLEDPEVKKRIADVIRNQREQVMNAALLSLATAEARVENYLAQRVLENPSNFGSLRPNSAMNSGTVPPPAETKPAETKPAEPKPTEPKAEEKKPAETKPATK
ncbi:MAG: SurA N-terminal domain-containing protein [Blastocatellia bacterium]|nr:SurA N-terminal domain-containing protein [Blastocatellia bacterium]